MKLIDNLKNIFKKKDEKEIVKQLEASYQQKKQNGEEHPIDSTIAQIMEIINNSEDPNKTAQKLLVAVLDANGMPNRMAEKLSILLANNENISDEAVTKAVEESKIDVPDEMIETILEEGNFEHHEDRLSLIQKVEDEKIVQDRLKNEFVILSKNCKSKKDGEVVDRLNELKDIAEQSDVYLNTQQLIENVVAVKMAENFYNDSMKGTKIYTLAKVWPADKMFEKDIASKVESEYRKIEQERGIKEDRFDKSMLRKQILSEIAKDVGYKYQKDDRAFIVPQSENMRKISNEEEQLFIKEVQTAYKHELDENQIMELKEEIRGIIKNKQAKEAMIIDKIKELKNEEKVVDLMLKVLSDEDKIKSIGMMNDSGLLDTFNNIPTETRRKTIEAINTTIIERNTINNQKENLDTENRQNNEELER